jgi:hypothetical protein
MQLFDDIERTNGNPAEAGEPLYAFVNQAAGADWQRVRDSLTEWLAAYPVDEQRSLISRFRRTDRRGFLGAFWELYLHELFRRLGFRIELHPEVAASTHRPDFRLHRGTTVIYVEAVTVYEPQAHSPDDARLAPLLATVNRISSPRFRLSVDARQIASTPLALTRLTDELESWFQILDTEADTNPARDRAFRWQEDGWMLFFRPIPRDAGATDDYDLTTGPARAKRADKYRSIRQQVMGKSRMYGRQFDAPFLIALTSYRAGHGPGAALRALFGPAATDSEMMRAGAIRRSRSRSSDGVWLTNKGLRFEDISAVLTAFDVMPWSITKNQPWLFENPWSSHPLKIELPFNRFDVDTTSGEIERVETGFEPWMHFGLPADWPSVSRTNGVEPEVDRWTSSN